MSRIDSALAKDPFTVDETQCMLLGDLLKAFSPGDSKQRWSGLSKESQVCFKIFFVAICHQINWDFLQERLFEGFASPDVEVMLHAAAEASPTYIEQILFGYHKPERIRAAERAKYLRQTAAALRESFDGKVLRLVETGSVFGDSGFISRLDKLPAFAEDPLRKKSSALAQELARERIVEFIDSAEIPPAIDYHLIRLYLRTGRVIPTSESVFNSLTTGVTHRPRLLKLLRAATSRALVTTAQYAGLPVHELNYLEWQLGRTRCEKDHMNCTGAWPDELADMSIRELSEDCPLRSSCLAFSTLEWRKLIEPALQFGKAYY